MNRFRTLAASGATLALLCSVRPATAANKTPEGQLQLGLNTPVLTASRLTEEQERDGNDVTTDIAGSEWGLFKETTLEVGYGIGGDVVLGALLQFGGGSANFDPDDDVSVERDDEVFHLMAGPKLDVMFLKKKVRPFFTVAAGYVNSWTTQDSEGGGLDTDFETTGFRGIGRLGARLFLARGFSFDPMFQFTYRYESDVRDDGGGDYDVDVRGFEAGLVLGFSGWL
jgi:hypothetical protein